MTDCEKYKFVCALLSVLLILVVTTLMLHRKDTDLKIAALDRQIQSLNKKSDAIHDDLLDTEKRITRVESQFWE